MHGDEHRLCSGSCSCSWGVLWPSISQVERAVGRLNSVGKRNVKGKAENCVRDQESASVFEVV